MARNDDRNENSIDSTYVEQDAVEHSGRDSSGSARDEYRDDDVGDPLPPDQRVRTKPDAKSAARGEARENVGNTVHDDIRPGGAPGGR